MLGDGVFVARPGPGPPRELSADLCVSPRSLFDVSLSLSLSLSLSCARPIRFAAVFRTVCYSAFGGIEPAVTLDSK